LPPGTGRSCGTTGENIRRRERLRGPSARLEAKLYVSQRWLTLPPRQAAARGLQETEMRPKVTTVQIWNCSISRLFKSCFEIFPVGLVHGIAGVEMHAHDFTWFQPAPAPCRLRNFRKSMENGRVSTPPPNSGREAVKLE